GAATEAARWLRLGAAYVWTSEPSCGRIWVRLCRCPAQPTTAATRAPGCTYWSPKLSDQLKQGSTTTATLRTTAARRTNAPGAPPSRQALDRRCRVMGGWW